ncbi:GntR family transcriptional regulator [Acuticoccus sediminis]|uniref:GntR family transcriptional regulator n=1 Tax=Acuticoccus sediminis TaxID=2184697 RepID=A0A8B2NJ86_9HYPH|nr:GntR family transcriptional regulator [Acuticoccus sediminis]RAH98346.1 GntR family transcriptional regulator [Acuticoccus sediminis]
MGQAADTAYAAIKEQIVRGQFAPNTAVDEGEVASRLGMSRTPVREALLRLQAESLVEIARGRGIRVLPVSITDMREAYQTISGLEMVAVQLLADMAPDADYLAPLHDAVARMRSAAADNDRMAWCDADEDFHRELMRLSGNRRLTTVGHQLRDFARRAHVVAVRLQSDDYTRRSTNNHAALLEALQTGRYEFAVDTHRLQRRRGEELLVGAVAAMNLSAL